jgi:hypothetical protein
MHIEDFEELKKTIMKAVHLIDDMRKINNLDLNVMQEACGQYILAVNKLLDIPVEMFENLLESWKREYRIAMKEKE